MTKKKEYIDGLIEGNDLILNKLKKLLARREDLRFEWRKDLEQLIDENEKEFHTLENTEENKNGKKN